MFSREFHISKREIMDMSLAQIKYYVSILEHEAEERKAEIREMKQRQEAITTGR